MSPQLKQEKALSTETAISSQSNLVGKGPILRMPVLKKHVGLSSSMLYEIQKFDSPYYDPSFPSAVRLSGKAVGWFAGEVDAWLESRPRTRPTTSNELLVTTEGEVTRG